MKIKCKLISCYFYLLIVFSTAVTSQYSEMFVSGFEDRKFYMNDTGIVKGGNSPGGNGSCFNNNVTLMQDCSVGRDNTHADNSDGIAGFSFTKIDMNGGELPDNAINWSCIKDNVTGLLWEVKTDNGDTHDKDNKYQWGGLTALGRDHIGRTGIYRDDWNSLITGSNSNSFCGVSGWRVPNIQELNTIVNLGGVDNVVLTNYFPNTEYLDCNLHMYWSSTPMANGFNDSWVICFKDGTHRYRPQNFEAYVRIVSLGKW